MAGKYLLSWLQINKSKTNVFPRSLKKSKRIYGVNWIGLPFAHNFSFEIAAII